MFGAFEHGAQLDGIGVCDGGADFDEFFDQVIERATDFDAVFEADLRPHLEWAAGNAGKILEARADEVERMRAVAADDVDDRRGDDVREMADAGDDFIML